MQSGQYYYKEHNSIALPLETVMLPFYASDLFGNKSFLNVLGIFSAANYLGYAIGAPLGNILYDMMGNYNLSFIVFALLMVFVTVTMQFVLRAASRDRAIILSSEEAEEKQA